MPAACSNVCLRVHFHAPPPLPSADFELSAAKFLTTMPGMNGAFYLIKDVERLGHLQHFLGAVLYAQVCW